MTSAAPLALLAPLRRRAVVVNAALLAAGRGSGVSMDVIERAYENEMHKLNRLVKELDLDTSPLQIQG